jgi:alpha-galactosidase
MSTFHISPLFLALVFGLILPQEVGAADNGLASEPLRGWSSWSCLMRNISEEKIKAEADVEAAQLKDSGYIYINVDDGWQGGYDENGRPLASKQKFPGGMKALADYIHAKGLKFGIYLVPGLNKDVWKSNARILGTSETVQQIADENVPGNTQGSAWHIDYSKPGSAEYIQSCADQLASWDVDYIKMDFVGPAPTGPNGKADNREDIQQWAAALKKTGRPIYLELSASLNFENAAFWKQYSNGWRIDGDVESHDTNTLTKWQNILSRFQDAPKWAPFAGPGGWNDLDSIDIGNGARDGLTPDERKSVMSLWCISCSPLLLGADLTQLDGDDLALLTNPEVLAVQAAGQVATPLSQSTPQQVWRAKNSDGSFIVALFNMDQSPAPMAITWSDLAIDGAATVHDLWSHRDLGRFDMKYADVVPPHGVILLRVSPVP